MGAFFLDNASLLQVKARRIEGKVLVGRTMVGKGGAGAKQDPCHPSYDENRFHVGTPFFSITRMGKPTASITQVGEGAVRDTFACKKLFFQRL